MRNYYLFILLLTFNLIYPHNINNDNLKLRHWKLEKQNKIIEGSFKMLKNGDVYIEDQNNNILSFPIEFLSKNDQQYANERAANIIAINNNSRIQIKIENPMVFYTSYILIALLLLFISWFLHKNFNKKKPLYLIPIICLGILFTLFSFAERKKSTTDPAFMASAFAPFSPNVVTNYDSNFFYVSSLGIPNHTMMVGISNRGWQQQVPIPKCYNGTDHWTIPLNPVLASTPVPVSALHFTKGAIAMASNGVPIFNPYTNTGVDAFLDGQLDNYGGHCGRGDDYHYHTAPLHLISSGQTTYNLPIAFGLDGYAVYGGLEPDGSAMATLDANHGHNGTNGVYHYHGTATAPYMIGNMVGVVNEDANKQIIPQPQGTPVRTENWGPLSGALITSCTPNSNNGYNLSYTLNNISGYATNYSVTGTTFSFQYVTPSSTTNTNYTSATLCTTATLGTSDVDIIQKNIKIYPNPASDIVQIHLGNTDLENDVQSITIYDLKGSIVAKTKKFVTVLNIRNLSKGSYFVKIQFSSQVVTKKLLVK